MIRYALQCAQGHAFESWFPSSDSYERQKAAGFVTCPHCGGAQVEKAMMAPSVARTDRMRAAPDEAPPAPPAPQMPAPAEPVALMSEPERVLRRMVKDLHDHITRNSDYVGDAFPDLARRMHHGEVEHRPIHGEATPEEVRALREEEVEVFPVPILPDERN